MKGCCNWAPLGAVIVTHLGKQLPLARAKPGQKHPIETEREGLKLSGYLQARNLPIA